ncbi:MAG: tRNA pseudouridine(38-40) synthase TruA [Acidiferrobacterales bacterium]
MRVAAIVEYDGSGFCGWQLQDDVRTVQGVVEEAIGGVANESVRVITAGRTDAGVHATGQVIHFDTLAERSPRSWVRGINSNLPQDVAILWAQEVDDDFHARFRATGRHYQYVIFNRPVRPTYLNGKVTWDYRPLDVEDMQAAAAFLTGTHDFSSFRTVHCQARDPVRELRQLTIQRKGETVLIHAYANAFLHHMVRNIAGVLMAIGAGERQTAWAQEVLAARDRTLGGMTAPADGLYLTSIEYPKHYNIKQLSPDSPLW